MQSPQGLYITLMVTYSTLRQKHTGIHFSIVTRDIFIFLGSDFTTTTAVGWVVVAPPLGTRLAYPAKLTYAMGQLDFFQGGCILYVFLGGCNS